MLDRAYTAYSARQCADLGAQAWKVNRPDHQQMIQPNNVHPPMVPSNHPRPYLRCTVLSGLQGQRGVDFDLCVGEPVYRPLLKTHGIEAALRRI